MQFFKFCNITLNIFKSTANIKFNKIKISGKVALYFLNIAVTIHK